MGCGGLRLLVFADLQNVTNRENAEEIVYSGNFRKQGTISGLPFMAVVGGGLLAWMWRKGWLRREEG